MGDAGFDFFAGDFFASSEPVEGVDGEWQPSPPSEPEPCGISNNDLDELEEAISPQPDAFFAETLGDIDTVDPKFGPILRLCY